MSDERSAAIVAARAERNEKREAQRKAKKALGQATQAYNLAVSATNAAQARLDAFYSQPERDLSPAELRDARIDEDAEHDNRDEDRS